MTSNCPKLIDFSKKSDNFLGDVDRWLKQIQDIMHKSFKKIRITGKKKPNHTEVDILMKAKQELRQKLGEIEGQDPFSENEIKANISEIENEISILCSEKNSKIVKDHMSQ